MKTKFTEFFRSLQLTLVQFFLKERIAVLLQVLNNILHLIAAYALQEAHRLAATVFSTIILLVMLRLVK